MTLPRTPMMIDKQLARELEATPDDEVLVIERQAGGSKYVILSEEKYDAVVEELLQLRQEKEARYAHE